MYKALSIETPSDRFDIYTIFILLRARVTSLMPLSFVVCLNTGENQTLLED